jgi:sRNA-binding carbon storage regulator CsrA
MALVLTREPGQAVYLNEGTPQEVKVTVSQICRNYVRLVFDAPSDMPIERDDYPARLARLRTAARTAEKSQPVMPLNPGPVA